MAQVVIFGNTAFTELVYFYIERDSEHGVVDFTVVGWHEHKD